MERLWWERGIIYQIYPRSFMDSNGDGIGDLAGIRGKLDYLEWLGVDALWLSPIYPSPMADFGYDITDYTDIDPVFGTLAEFDALAGDVHRRGMKLLLDFVPNHTSAQHPWFLEARSSRESRKRDWYIWRDPKPGGGPPNNWRSVFSGSAWEFDAETGQYFYHAFLKEQPDLNWRNPEVQDAMLATMRFWLERGIDGFRVDVIWHLIKDDELRDNPPNPYYMPGQKSFDEYLAIYSTDRPEVHDIIARMRSLIDKYPDRMLVGEVYLPIEKLMAYYGAAGQGAHLPFNFHLMHSAWNSRDIGKLVTSYEASLPEYGWPNWVLSNHDQSRVAARIGRPQARIAAMLLLTLRGTPTMYYGDEIGMRDVAIAPNMIQDPCEKREPGRGHGRDPQRTPMQWNRSHAAGFTSSTPWLPVAADFEQYNVESEREEPVSFLALYRKLIELRRANPALAIGSYREVLVNSDILAYCREYEGVEFLIVLNFSSMSMEAAMDELKARHARIQVSTHMDRLGEEIGTGLHLRGDEGVVLRLY